VRQLEPVTFSESRRALVTVLDELSDEREASSPAMLSEVALSDWMRREEDAAWARLQQGG
jgi:hypothetical protein